MWDVAKYFTSDHSKGVPLDTLPPPPPSNGHVKRHNGIAREGLGSSIKPPLVIRKLKEKNELAAFLLGIV